MRTLSSAIIRRVVLILTVLLIGSTIVLPQLHVSGVIEHAQSSESETPDNSASEDSCESTGDDALITSQYIIQTLRQTMLEAGHESMLIGFNQSPHPRPPRA